MDNQGSSPKEIKLSQAKLDEKVPQFNSLELEKQKGDNFRSNIDKFTKSGIAISIVAALFTSTLFHTIGVEENIDRLIEDKSISALEKVQTASQIRKEHYSDLYKILAPLLGAVLGYYFATKTNEN